MNYSSQKISFKNYNKLIHKNVINYKIKRLRLKNQIKKIYNWQKKIRFFLKIQQKKLNMNRKLIT